MCSPTATCVRRHARLGAVADDGGFRRREVHQRADGVARAIHAARFEVLREREEKDDGRGLRPLADGDGARRRRSSSARSCRGRVGASALHARRDRVHAAGRHDRQQRRRATRAASRAVRRDWAARLTARTHRSASSEASLAGRGDAEAPRARATHACRCRRPRRDGARRLSRAASYCTCSRPAMTSAREGLEAAQVLQPALDERDFLVAVHALDAEDRLGVDLADRAGGAFAYRAHVSDPGGRRRLPRRGAALRQQPTMWSSSRR